MASIQWFPGHMSKTGRELQESVKLADLIIEVMDARIPGSSGNPEFDKIFAGRRRLIILNKNDLADPKRSEKWKTHFRVNGIEALFTNARNGDGVSQIRKIMRKAALEKVQKQAARGVVNRPLRAVVAGIPNSGKSALINNLAGKASAKTGDRPGVTRNRQWIRLEGGVELLDTPGILWPKFENEEVALHLAFTGAIRDAILDVTDVAERLLNELCRDYPRLVTGRYGEIGDIMEKGSGKPDGQSLTQLYPMLENVGRKRGFLIKGGQIDLERAATIVLDEFRAARIGRITLEEP